LSGLGAINEKGKWMKSKKEYIADYYENFFSSLCNTGLQGKGSDMFHKSVEAYWRSDSPGIILEVGAGGGAHFPFIRSINNPENAKYVALDIRDETAPKETQEIRDRVLKITWKQGSVENIPFADNYFDRVISTCLLHHLDDPFGSLLEIRRVLKVGGEFSIGMPTDPGYLNRFIKRIYTYPKAIRL
jgi:phosphatidylethanolamine/phosphatidyl-N-methylethanolamine N-methyltransferase